VRLIGDYFPEKFFFGSQLLVRIQANKRTQSVVSQWLKIAHQPIFILCLFTKVDVLLSIQGKTGQKSDEQDERDRRVAVVFSWIHKCMKTPSVNFLAGKEC